MHYTRNTVNKIMCFAVERTLTASCLIILKMLEEFANSSGEDKQLVNEIVVNMLDAIGQVGRNFEEQWPEISTTAGHKLAIAECDNLAFYKDYEDHRDNAIAHMLKCAIINFDVNGHDTSFATQVLLDEFRGSLIELDANGINESLPDELKEFLADNIDKRHDDPEAFVAEFARRMSEATAIITIGGITKH